MYVITAHQRHRQTDRQTDVKRSHDRYIAKACSGKNDRKVVTKVTMTTIMTNAKAGEGVCRHVKTWTVAGTAAMTTENRHYSTSESVR